jgi:hypothetical protein
VSLIQDEDLVPITSRSKHSAFTKITCVVDTVVAGCVDFDDIEGSAAVARKFNTAGANAAGSVSRSFSTVKAASQDAG